ncbi:MAG: alcohol dehydrogenase catalytic domain-containing protein, partial [Candidatus Binataceae bacterium]
MKAAILRELKQPLSIEEIEIGHPDEHEVLIRTVAVGVCHSDLHCLHGSIPTRLPAVLGHEPAGIIEEVGSAVTTLKPG